MLQNNVTPDNLDDMIADFDQSDNLEDLAAFVRDAATVARRHRQNIGVDSQMEKAARAVRSLYNPEDIPLLDHNCIYMGLTNLKVRAFRSWVADILINAEDKPWTLRASPEPNLPRQIEDEVIDTLLSELASETEFEGTIISRLTELKRVAESHIKAVTDESAKNMESLVHDQMLEGNWRETFDEFIDDLGTMPAAILKGPVVEFSDRIKWDRDSNKTKNVQTPLYVTKRVDPRNIYPSPDSTSTQNGAYIVEKMQMDTGQLLGAANISGFREAAIRYALALHACGWRWMEARDPDEELTEGVKPDDTPTDAGTIYDVIVYYGKIHGKILHEWGVADVDVQNTYESEVWVCGDVVIKAVKNPYPGGRRPFYSTSFDKYPGSFWGQGLPSLLEDIQRIANAMARALIKNTAFASGPIGEYDTSRLAEEEDISELTPYRMYAVDADSLANNTMPAFRFHQPTLIAPALMDLYERFMRQADDVSGIPAYVLGNPQVAGAGRTLGGLSLLMGNAAKGIKKVIAQIDKDVIEPVVTTYTHMNLELSDDPTIKFDTQVIARGSSGLLQRELSQARAVEVLQMLTPYAQAGIVPPEGLQLVLRDVIRGLGYNADEVIPDPQRQQELVDFLSQQTGGGLGPQASSQPGTPPPALDGRSLPPPLAPEITGQAPLQLTS